MTVLATALPVKLIAVDCCSRRSSIKSIRLLLKLLLLLQQATAISSTGSAAANMAHEALCSMQNLLLLTEKAAAGAH